MKRWPLLLLIVFAIISLIIPIQIALSGVVSSPTINFNVTPDTVYLNWTNNYTSNITLTLNTTFGSVIVKILNETSVNENYSQSNSQTYCTGYYLYVKNVSGEYNNTIGPLDATTPTVNVTLIDNTVVNHLTCKPGRYWIEKLNITNTSQANETANIIVFIDIPISSSNSVNANLPLTGIANFNGQIPANATTYHSYFFNTSGFGNATGVYINVSGWSSSQDVDLFLFDNSTVPTLLAKSIAKTGTSESLFYSFLPNVSAIYEIRLYGNSTSAISYSGNIIFTAMDSTARTLNFGVRNVSATATQNLVLNNTGNISLSGVAESKDLYWISRTSSSGTRNLTLLVPDSSVASKVKISLNWTGLGNYSFNLYNANGNVIASSLSKYAYANVTGAMQEEYAESTSITKGTWIIEVKSNTPTDEAYTLTSYIYVVNASQWIATNYTTSDFNRSGNPNSTYSANISLTVPNNTMNGLYEGYIRYTDSRGGWITIPVNVNVTVPMLVVNNTLDSQTFRVDEDYGKNVTRFLNFSITNLGAYSLTVNFTDSGNLSCSSGSCSSGIHNASFSYNASSPIPANTTYLMNVSVTFNSSLPLGTYEGWIKVYSNNTDFNLTSHPYQNFTITIKLNLTNILTVRPTAILSSRTINGNPSVYYNSSLLTENISIQSLIYYLNDITQIGDEKDKDFNITDFSVWLTETNTSYRIPATGSLTIFNGTNPLYYGNVYNITATIPANQPGGRYNVNVNVTYRNNDSFAYWGTGVNNSLFINNTGLQMSSNVTDCSFGSSCSASLSISNTSTYRFFVNVSNYGPLNASSDYLAFSESCDGYSVAYTGYSGDCTISGAANSTLTFVHAQNTSCLIWYTITAGTSAASACTAYLIGSPTSHWFNPYGINASITVTAGSGGSGTTPPGDSGTPTTPTYVANLQFTKAESLVLIQQNSTNTTTIVVKNTGNKSQSITFSIETLNSSWYSINATTATIAVNKEAAFRITFAIGKIAVKDYSGKYKAASSEKTITSDFSLRVLPTAEEKVTINDTLALYKLNMTKLSDEINKTKAAGINVSAAEAKLSQLRTTIEQAETYISNGDYFSAYQLFNQIETLSRAVETELNAAKQQSAEQTRFMWTIAAVAIVVVAVGTVLAYLFWPTKVYTPGKKQYASKPKDEEWSQLKEKWSKGRQGYRTVERESFFDKIKNIFRRKQ